jgi:hypothetical protein
MSDAIGKEAGVSKDVPREDPSSQHWEKTKQAGYPTHCRGGASWVEKNWYGHSLSLGSTSIDLNRRPE